MEIEVLEGRSPWSLFQDGEWYRCHICGWRGYFRENVPDEYKLYRYELEEVSECKWCVEWRYWHRESTGCPVCYWEGFRFVIGSEPDELAVCDFPGSGTLCVPCIRHYRFAEGQLASVKRYVIKWLLRTTPSPALDTHLHQKIVKYLA